MNTDFIEWMCGKTDYFEVWEDKVYYMDEVANSESLYYPLLLQRAIEGVNSSGEKYFITQEPNEIIVGENECEYKKGFPDYEVSGDKAKESALYYIYKLENKCANTR